MRRKNGGASLGPIPLDDPGISLERLHDARMPADGMARGRRLGYGCAKRFTVNESLRRIQGGDE